jgi:cysteine desulfurase family protein (TIGR01976 family)
MNPFPSMEEIRAQFPALESSTRFMENAGGSQVPQSVIDAVSSYFVNSYVQLGAGYEQSNAADAIVREAHKFADDFVNAGGRGQCVIGPSTTRLLANVGRAYRRTLRAGDEIIVSLANHESNIGPWVQLEETAGVRIVWWPVDPNTHIVDPRTLSPLVNRRTRLICIPHVSNLIGHVTDVKAVSKIAHLMGAEVVVDGVAFAPHRAVDVAALDADWYVFSPYKTFAPHMGVLYGRHLSWAPLTGPNHFFIPRDDIEHKWELGGPSHEACAGWVGLQPYLAFLAGTEYEGRKTIEATFTRVEMLERRLTEKLVNFLVQHPNITVIGPGMGADRLPTVSFIHRSKTSAEIAAALQESRFAVRRGHMYAYRLCESLGLTPEDGVVRISLVHYNTAKEVDSLIVALTEVL